MKRNSAIDIAKYVAAILVVAIHTRLFADVSAELDFAFVDIVCRLAVPFFAVCTGFYLAKAIAAQGNLTSVWRSLRKVMVMYTGWSMVYLLIHLIDWHNSGTLCSEYLVGWCKSFFVSSSYYHLWYLSALIYALPIYALIIKLAPPQIFLVIAVPLWIYKAVSYGYVDFLSSVWKDVFSFSFPIEALITGVIFMLPLLLAGAWLANRNIEEMNEKTLSIISFVGFSLLCVEAYHLRAMGGERYSFIFFTFPLAIILFAYLYLIGRHVNIQSSQWAKVSMIIYCMHPAVIWMQKDYVNHSLLLFLIVAVVTSSISLIPVKLANR